MQNVFVKHFPKGMKYDKKSATFPIFTSPNTKINSQKHFHFLT